MFSTDEFKAFTGRVVPFLHNTSWVKDEPYPDLLREKGGNGFPTVSFLDHTGRLLTQQPYPLRKTQDLEKTLGRLEVWQKLSRAVASGAKDQAPRLFMTEIDLGMMKYAGSRKRYAQVRDALTKGERKRVEAALVEMEFQSIARTVRENDRKSMAAAGKGFVAMIEKDRIPRSRQVITFWQAALAYAESRKDADLFEKVFERAKKEMAGDPRAKRYIQMVERRLEQLRGGR